MASLTSIQDSYPDKFPHGKSKDTPIFEKTSETPPPSTIKSKVKQKAVTTLQTSPAEEKPSSITSHKVIPRVRGKKTLSSKKTPLSGPGKLKDRVKVQTEKSDPKSKAKQAKDSGKVNSSLLKEKIPKRIPSASYKIEVQEKPLRLHEQERFVLSPPSLDGPVDITPESYDEGSEEMDFPEMDLDSFVKNKTVPMPKGTIFSDQDILIFKNAYTGKMPSNGIKQKDFEKLLQLESDIIRGQGIFSIKGNFKFVTFVKDNLKGLLQSEEGRILLLGLAKKNMKIEVIEGKNTEQKVHYNKNGSYTMYLTNVPKKSREFSISTIPDGSREFHEFTPFRALYHELTHALLEDPTAETLPPLPEDLEHIWHFEEELKAITGLTAAQHIKLREFVANICRVLPSIESDLKGEADEMSEKELAAELAAEDKSFGDISRSFENALNIKLELPPRTDHWGLHKPDNLKIMGPELSEKMHEYFSVLVNENFTDEMHEIFALNPDIATKTFKDNPILDDIFIQIFAAEDETLLTKYIEAGFPLDADFDAMNLFQHALAEGRLDLAGYLFSLPNNQEFIESLDDNFNSLLHIALFIDDAEVRKEMINFLVDQNLNPMQLDSNDESPLYLAIKQDMPEELSLMLRNLDEESFAEAFEHAIDLGKEICIDVFLQNANENCLKRIALFAFEFADNSTIHQIVQFMNDTQNSFLIKDSETDENLIHKILRNEKLTIDERVILISHLKTKHVSLRDKDIDGNSCMLLCHSANLLTAIHKYEQEKRKEIMAKIREIEE